MVLGKDVRPRPEYGPETASDGLYRRNKGIKKPSGGPVKVVPDGHVTFGFERSVQITHGSNTQVTLKSHLVSVPTNPYISANALICGTIPTNYLCLSFTLFVLSPVYSVIYITIKGGCLSMGQPPFGLVIMLWDYLCAAPMMSLRRVIPRRCISRGRSSMMFLQA